MSTRQTQPRYTLQEAAAHLHMGDNALFAELRRRRILDPHNIAHWRTKDAGYFVERERAYKHPIAGVRFYTRTFVTPSGLDWLRNVLADCSEATA